MDAIQRKELLHLRIEQANEEMQIVLAKVVEALFQTYQPEVIKDQDASTDEELENLPTPPWATKQTVAERNEKLIEADAECDRGAFVTLESLQEETATW
jgi:hypothetical protein